jgi:hypothetical protein
MDIVKHRSYLQQLGNKIPANYDKRVISKEGCVNLINCDLRIQGVNQLVQSLPVKELKSWVRGVEESVLKSNENNPNSVVVMRKRMKESIVEVGLKEYIEKLEPSKKLLRESISLMGHETECSDRNELIGILLEKVTAAGLEYMLNSLPMKILKQMASDLKINIKSTSGPVFVRHLLERKDYVPEPKKRKDGSIIVRTPNVKVKEEPDSSKSSKKRTRKPKVKLSDMVLDFGSDDDTEFTTDGIIEFELSIESDENGDYFTDSDSSTEEDDLDDLDYEIKPRGSSKRRRRSHRSSGESSKKSTRTKQ